MAEAFSKDRITPLFRDTPSLNTKLSDKTRDKGAFATNNTIAHKVFSGGHLTIIGSNSPSQLASRPIKILLVDEVDRFSESAGKEGDPVLLAIKRTTTFRDRKILLISTPVIKGKSRIEQAFLESDQRYYWVPCRHCKLEQKLVWEQVFWENDDYKTARYTCNQCGSEWTDLDRWDALKIGKWLPTKPFNGTAGFHLSSLYSPWVTVEEIVRGYIESKRGGEEQIKVWWNTVLGLPYAENREQTPIDTLLTRVEDFSVDRIPNEVAYLTLGADTQDDRIEYSILGWGLKKECYVLAHSIIEGNTTQSEVWKDMEKVLTKSFYKMDGSILKIGASCFDSGGHATLQVYAFATSQTKKRRRVYAIKGKGGTGPAFEYRAKKSITHNAHRFYSIGADTTKSELFSRLKLQEPGENYIHFSANLQAEYFAQLTSESPVHEKDKKVWKSKSNARRETADCWRYGFAALFSDQEQAYNSACRDFEAKLKNETVEKAAVVQTSSYLESRRYS